MEYIVVEKNDIHDLVEEVNRLIKEGWIPQGGVSCFLVRNESYRLYIQALVREKNSPTS